MGIIILLDAPFVQHFIATSVANALANKLQTDVSIGRIDLGLFNRIIIDDLQLNDRSKHELVAATRFSAKFDIIPLFKGKVRIHSIQLFGFDIRLNKETPQSKPNYQFLIDAFSSKKKNTKPSNLDLRINSVIMRRGRFSYDIFSKKQTTDRFNASHIRMHNISATLNIKVLRKDSINVAVKRLNFDDESGLSVNKFAFRLIANKHDMFIKNFKLRLQNTLIRTKTIHLTYENLNAFKNFADQVHFNIGTEPSYINLHDISVFVPAFKNFKNKMNLSINAQGTVNRCKISYLSFDAGKKLQIRMNAFIRGTTRLSSAYFYANMSHLFINKDGLSFISDNFIKKTGKLPHILSNLGNISFKGKVSGYTSQISMNGLFNIANGTLRTNVSIGHKLQRTLTFKGTLIGTNLDLNKITGDKKWGQSNFNIEVNALQKSSQRYPTVMTKGLISSLFYNNYCYKNISIDGLYKNGGFNGMAGIDDPNGTIRLNGNINFVNPVPKINLTADINKVRPYNLKLTQQYKNTEFSVKIKADFTGKSIDKMMGNVYIDSLSYISPEKTYFMKSMSIGSSVENRQKVLTVKSEMADAKFIGNFRYRTLGASVKDMISTYLPSLVKPRKHEHSDNNFKFDINIYNTEILPAIFDIPLHVGAYSHITGYIDERNEKMHVEGFIPQLRYKNDEYQSGYFICENPSDKFHSLVRFNQVRKNGTIGYSINMLAKDDTLNTSLRWGNNAAETYSGQIRTLTHFLKSNDKSHIKALLNVKPTNIIVNDTIWQIHPSQITLNKGSVDVDNFLFSHNDRFIHINGKMSSNPTDTIKMNLQDINLTYIFNILNFNDVDFKGEISGDINICNIIKKPRISGFLSVRDFTFNNGTLGDGNIVAAWDNDKEGVSLDAHLSEPNLSRTHITGYIFPKKPKDGLDLEIEAEHTNIKFVEHFTSAIFNELNGRATGKAHLYGKFNELNLNADLLTDASAKIGILNTNFILRDSLHITPTEIKLNKTKIYDPEGHEGTMNGYISFKYLKNFNYRIRLDFTNMMLMNTHETEDLPFYGKVYATGNTIIQGGPNKGLDITSAIKTNKNTTFVYINRNTTSAINNQFITFIDKTPRRDIDSIEIINPLADVLKNVSSDIHFNLQVEATPDATLKIIMDPLAGDNITARGKGNIRSEFYNKGDFKMFGTYHITEGNYKFSLQQVIRKDFTIKDGSTITFNGAPLDANINIQAAYTVSSASLTDLIPTAASIVKQTNVKVNCLMNLTGILPHPTITFNLELPNEQDEIQTLVRNYISTDEQMNTQILYLLSIGKFYTQDTNNGSTTQNSNMMSSVLSSTISGQLNNMLSQLDVKNWNFGTNLSTGQNGWTDMEVEGMLSGKLLNNRLIVNGNFGYRDNPLANSNFIGDFEAELLLNHSGSIRLKAYNETNDRYYTKTNLTTQGIGIIIEKEFDKWKELFFWNRWKLKTVRNTNRKEEKNKVNASSKN